jgi:hypothetical protein
MEEILGRADGTGKSDAVSMRGCRWASSEKIPILIPEVGNKPSDPCMADSGCVYGIPAIGFSGSGDPPFSPMT